MKRRNFIRTSGISLAALLMNDSLMAFSASAKKSKLNFPEEVNAIVNDQLVNLSGKNLQHWSFQELLVEVKDGG